MREADRRTIAPREEIQARNRRVLIEAEIRQATAKPEPGWLDGLLARHREELITIAAGCLRRLEEIDRKARL